MEVKTIREIVDFLFQNKILAHIETKEGSWHNGMITQVNDGSFVIDERVHGPTPLAFIEIKKVARFISK